MKISRKYRILIVLGIALILILMGLIPMIFQVELNQNIMDRVSLVLMIVAAAVLFGGRRAEADAAKEADGNDNTAEQDEAKEADDNDNTAEQDEAKEADGNDNTAEQDEA